MSYDNYLTFARGLTQHFADRVVGLDSSSQRIVKLRPSDHVLGGFLTPARVAEEADENEPADDLPQDSAYEQASLGLEWLASSSGCAAAIAEISVSLSLYVRVMPTFNEQETHLSWEVLRHAPVGSGAQTERQAEIIPVWWRVDLTDLTERVNLSELVARRKLVFPLTQQLTSKWGDAKGALPCRYPTASALTITKSQFTPEEFPSWCQRIKPSERLENWSLDLDARFTPVPTEPGFGRISLRLINRTPERGRRAVEFFDANLYAPRVSVQIPKSAHRAGMFRELEQSYRYDLSLPAVGLNCHASVEHRDGKVTLRTNSVPTKEVTRLEPRRLDTSATPTFLRLKSDPVPILRRILQAMKSYNETDWQRKINSLEGRQQKEAEYDRSRFQRDEIEAFDRGIQLLENSKYPFVLRAFRLMNEAMGDVAAGRGLDSRKLIGRRQYGE